MCVCVCGGGGMRARSSGGRDLGFDNVVFLITEAALPSENSTENGTTGTVSYMLLTLLQTATDTTLLLQHQDTYCYYTAAAAANKTTL